MLYRQAGIFHTNYASDRGLFPIGFDRRAVMVLLALAIAAPFFVSSLFLSSTMLPWLVWTAAALGLNLVLGWAGQFHFGYAAIMGIGAYTAVHAARFGIPWELAVILEDRLKVKVPDRTVMNARTVGDLEAAIGAEA